jgi:cell division protein ZipA
LLAAVIGHGFWLAWRARRDPLKLDIDPNIPKDDVDPFQLLRGELPNGGARVIPAVASGAPPAEQRTLDLGASEQAKHRTAPTLVTEDRAAPRRETVHQEPPRRAEPPIRTEPPIRAEGAARPTVAQPGNGPRKSILDRPKPKLAPRNKEAATPKPVEREKPASTMASAVQDEIIVVHVLARGAARFPGTELMNAFLRNTLKFGDMNIFHRIDPISKQARFSVASAVEPGTFDLAKMDTYSTAGVTFFLRLPGPPDPMATFDDMLGVARDVATSMAGDLKDDQRSVLTAQTIEHCRQRISEFSRKRMSQRG